MCVIDRRILSPAALALLLFLAGAAIAQAPPTGRPSGAAPAQARATPSANDPVVATYEGGQITRSQVLEFLGQFAIPPDAREEVYTTGINALINQELFARFLQAQNVAVTAAELDAEVAKLGQQLQQSGQGSLNSLMAELGLTETELRERLAMNLQWAKYLRSQADEATLRAYFEKNKDLFTGTTLQASHILMRVEPEATDAEKQAARQKLVDLKKQIDEGALDFAVAADKFSEDPSNQEAPDGGNIGYFSRRGQVVEPFAEAAFALDVGAVSDPVETEYGYHLIKVTDRRSGQDVTFEEIRDAVEAVYGEELQQSIIEEARETAKIDIKPMPENFFPAPTPAVGIPGAPTPGTVPGQSPR
ncbi:peptidylprolyl isomerase [Tautonia marina]|uniref:peptidylprolyl isomerase n=1 Tax=Tautonia marina TaxID=2653855 RepID=UPI00137588FD|nr:peptidylprolyl isomerase [Tautonia marina]